MTAATESIQGMEVGKPVELITMVLGLMAAVAAMRRSRLLSAGRPIVVRSTPVKVSHQQGRCVQFQSCLPSVSHSGAWLTKTNATSDDRAASTAGLRRFVS